MHGFEVLGFTGSRVRILAHPPTLADQIEASLRRDLDEAAFWAAKAGSAHQSYAAGLRQAASR
jgi:hypothetical protein